MCMAYDFDPAVCLTEKAVRARKSHRCDECGRTVPPGETYTRTTALWEKGGRWDTYVTCAHCLEARRWLLHECSAFLYTMVREDVMEHWLDNDLCRSLTFGRLCVLARDRWKRHGELVPVDTVRSLVDRLVRTVEVEHG